MQNTQTLCSECRTVVLKMQRHYAQNARNSCSKCGNVMLKMHKTHAQNAETLCSKCTKPMLKMRKRYAQKSCSKCRNIMLKNAETLCSKIKVVWVPLFLRPCQDAQTINYQAFIKTTFTVLQLGMDSLSFSFFV